MPDSPEMSSSGDSVPRVTIGSLLSTLVRNRRSLAYLFLQLGLLFTIAFGALAVIVHLMPPNNSFIAVYGLIVAFLAVSVGVSIRSSLIDVSQQSILLHAERKAVESDAPKAAWDLARLKLENYLDRNLSQVRQIFWLTVAVMAIGFGLIFFGIIHAMDNQTSWPIAAICATSGVVTNAIGGTFLIIYRNIMAQAKEYVTVLERINAVGMAVQIVETIADGQSDLRDTTRAKIAENLLTMYGKKAGDVDHR